MTDEKEGWLPTAKAADYLGFAPKTLQNWRSERMGPNFSKLKNRCFYRPGDLRDFRDKNAVSVHTH